MTGPPTSDTEHRRHNLRTRALLALRRAGVTTVGQLGARTDDRLRGVTNVGVDSVAELRRATVDADLAADEALSRLVWPRPLSPRDRETLAMRDEGIHLCRDRAAARYLHGAGTPDPDPSQHPAGVTV
jgi:hypothetical protein